MCLQPTYLVQQTETASANYTAFAAYTLCKALYVGGALPYLLLFVRLVLCPRVVCWVRRMGGPLQKVFEQTCLHLRTFAKSRGRAWERAIHMLLHSMALRLEGSGYRVLGTPYKRSIKVRRMPQLPYAVLCRTMLSCPVLFFAVLQ